MPGVDVPFDIPDAPLDRLPDIFEFALGMVRVDGRGGDDAAMAAAAERYPDVAGVVILQDGD